MAKNSTTPPQANTTNAVLGILLVASLAGNVAFGMQLLGPAKKADTVWLSSQSTMRGTLSSEQRLSSGDTAPEYDFAFGMRKNMELSKANCVLDECFMNMDVTLPVGSLPDAYAASLGDIAQKERDIASQLNAEAASHKDSALLKMQAAQQIRVAVLSFMMAKYGVPAKASESGVPLTGSSDATCKQVQDELTSLQKAYNTELARADIASHPDLDYIYRQLVTQTTNVHLPLAQSCAK